MYIESGTALVARYSSLINILLEAVVVPLLSSTSFLFDDGGILASARTGSVLLLLVLVGGTERSSCSKGVIVDVAGSFSPILSCSTTPFLMEEEQHTSEWGV